MKENKAAIYCRLSSEDVDKISKADDSESILNQKLMLTDYAHRHGMAVYKIYVDDDYSGLDRNRPAFNEMITDAEKGCFNIILCKHLSRFTRDLEVVEKYIHGLFLEWGVRFISLIDNVDTEIKGNKKARQIYGLTNEWYVEELSDNIRAVFRRKMEDGQFLGSFAPYGYKKSPEDRHKLEIDQEAAAVVREIFDLYLQGYGCTGICGILSDRAILPPSAYKKAAGLNYKNPNGVRYSEAYGLWSPNTVKRILRNEVYIGRLIQGRERKLSYKSAKVVVAPREEWVVKDKNHVPIIDETTFETVQKLMGSRRNSAKAMADRKQPEKAHVLGGKVYCLDCGSPLHRSGISRDGSFYYLKCGLARKSKNKGCSPHSTKLNDIEKACESQIKNLMCDYIRDEKKAAGIIANFHGENNPYRKTGILEKELRSCETRSDALLSTIAAAYMDKSRGLLCEKDFLNIKKVYDKDLENIKNRQIYLENEIEKIKIQQDLMKNLDKSLHRYIDFEELTHELVNDFIDKIEVGERDSSGNQAVVIHWLC